MHFTLKTAIVTSAMLSQIPLLISSEVYPGAMAVGSTGGLWLPPCNYAVGYNFESPSKEKVEIFLTFDETIIPPLQNAISAMGAYSPKPPFKGEADPQEEDEKPHETDEQRERRSAIASSSLILGIDDAIASIDLASGKVDDTQLEPSYHTEEFDFSQHFTFNGERETYTAPVREFIALAEEEIKREEAPDVKSDGIFAIKEDALEEEITADEELVLAKAFHSVNNDRVFAFFDSEPDFEELSRDEQSRLSKAFHSFTFDVALAALDSETELEELSSYEEDLLAKAFQSMPSRFPLMAFEKEVELEELSLEEETLLGRAFESTRLQFPLIAFESEAEIEDLTAEEEKYLAKAFQSFDDHKEFLAVLESAPEKGEITYNHVQKPSYLTAKFVKEITEELVFRDIPKVDANPETFDVTETPEDEETSPESLVTVDLPMKEEMLAHLSGLEIDDDEFVALNEVGYKAKPPPTPPVEEQNADSDLQFLKKLEIMHKVKEWERSIEETKAAQEGPGKVVKAEKIVPVQLLYFAVESTKFNPKKEPGRPKRSFAITAHPVTNAEYQEYLIATKKQAPSHWWRGTYKEGEGDLPVLGLSYLEAEAYAEWKGMRLPTEGELKFAFEARPDAGFDDPSWVLVEEKGVAGMLKKKQNAYQADPERCVFCVKP